MEKSTKFEFFQPFYSNVSKTKISFIIHSPFSMNFISFLVKCQAAFTRKSIDALIYFASYIIPSMNNQSSHQG